MNGQSWTGRILLFFGAIVIIASIPGVGPPGIIGLQDFPGRLVLAAGTVVLAIGTLLVGVSTQEQPV